MTSRPVSIIAHRGASSDAPENTLAAIRKAIALAADYVEIDVRLSLDEVPVAFHDPSLRRMTGTKGAPLIYQLALSEIQKFDVGSRFSREFRGEKIPTLQEVLQLDWNRTGLMIEIKSSRRSPKKIVKAIAHALASAPRLPPKVLVGSFSSKIVNELKKQLPSEIEVVGIAERADMLFRFVEADINRIALWHKLISSDLMQLLTARRIEVWAFTVDDIEIAKELISLGVSGIICNSPGRMRQQTEK